MIPNLASDSAPDSVPDLAPDWGDDSGGCCVAGGKFCAQLAALDSANKRANTNRKLTENQKLLRPQEAAELRSAGTLRLRSGQAGEGARPRASKLSRNSGWLTMKYFGFDESHNGTRCSQKES
jgi:hypothetical protein